MLGSSLSLVKACEGAVVPLVEPPRLADGQVALADLLQDLAQRGLGPRQEAGVGQVGGVAGLLEGLPARRGLLLALLGEVGIEPATVGRGVAQW